MRLPAVLVATALSACVDFYPDINEGCDSAADRCPDNLAYDECVDGAIDRLSSKPEEAQTVYDCLADTSCDAVESCLHSD